ncbi:MAG: hypothetical protein Q8L48_13105 [Archangium sp.]|nr:hypothetical protein [Archangium sp.]
MPKISRPPTMPKTTPTKPGAKPKKPATPAKPGKSDGWKPGTSKPGRKPVE